MKQKNNYTEKFIYKLYGVVVTIYKVVITIGRFIISSYKPNDMKIEDVKIHCVISGAISLLSSLVTGLCIYDLMQGPKTNVIDYFVVVNVFVFACAFAIIVSIDIEEIKTHKQ